jgi:hypothetical protein
MRKQKPAQSQFYSYLLFSFAAAILSSKSASAFPELIRHGYVNCITCHVSPSGGGTINDYGRTFSGEGLSMGTRKEEESFLHGLVKREKIPKWLSIGGDVRAAQVFLYNQKTTVAQSIMMQADFELAARSGNVTVDASGGRIQTTQAKPPQPGSHRYFAMYNFSEELMLRAGRFTPVYGINLPDHIIDTRMPLQLDQGQETDNVEASWITDSWNVILTGLKGPVDFDQVQQESGGAAQIAYAFKDTYKVGASAWSSRSNTQARQMAGVHALLGFSEMLYYMGELDSQWTTQLAANTSLQGIYDYNRLGYEVIRGAHLLGTVELWQPDSKTANTVNERYGIGTQLFPRPHFDIQAIWTKWRVRSSGDYFQDYAWAVVHYYF